MALDRYHAMLDRVGNAAAAVGRDADSITVVAVSKGQSVSDIKAVYDAGHRDFGENRAQEMSDKMQLLPSDIRWHFVGSLQSNKTRLVRSSTYLLHSLDRPSLAKSWLKGIGKPPPVLIQVNVGNESQKGGVAPNELSELAQLARGLGLVVRGLMAIPPNPEDPEDSRPYFAMLRELRDSVQVAFPEIEGLSMGMTDDFEVGISEGASFIRVGRAIFGPRH